MTDLFTYEIVEALDAGGCPLCRVAELDEERKMASFFREGFRAREGRLHLDAARTSASLVDALREPAKGREQRSSTDVVRHYGGSG